MTNKYIRQMLERQLARLEQAAETHDHPRVLTGISREMTAIARILLTKEPDEAEAQHE